MQTTFALAALVAVAYAAPQGVTQDISPPGQPLCNPTFSGEFQIQAVKPATKRDLTERASTCGSPGSLTLKLADGKLTDGQGRVGYIAANFQFQFDAPPQTGAIFTDGFSACSNTSLALGSSAVFYQCLSGNFFNLYDRSWAAQCEPVLLQILPCSSSTPSNGVGQSADGQPTGTAVGPVSQISDGQPQGQSAVPITELTDGQPQVPTVVPKPITQISDGQVQAPTSTAAPISQISDGQVQAPTSVAVPISQISDGQVQAPTSTAVPITQISDGQVQAPTSTVAPITQISDGQVQAPTSTVAPIAQISDGQIQAPTSTAAPITQIGDGQIQAPGNATTTATPVPFTGAGNSFSVASGFAAVVMGLVSVLLL